MDPRVIQQLQNTLAFTLALEARHARFALERRRFLEDKRRAIANHYRWQTQHRAAVSAHAAIMGNGGSPLK